MINTEIKYPRIGVGVMIRNREGEVLLGLRKGSHGSGEWSFPGGHLEFGEKIFETARREVREETGLKISKFNLISVSDDMRYIEKNSKHYLTIGVEGFYEGGVAVVCEADKCREWKWFNLDDLPDKLFEGTQLTIKNFKASKIYQAN